MVSKLPPRVATLTATVCCTLTLAGCAVDPSKPMDAAMACPQIEEEMAAQDAAQKRSEERASDMRPGYYAYQAATMIPIVGDAMTLVDLASDASHGRELDHLNEDVRHARRRREHLAKMHAGRCPTTAPG